jgi:hypothetical protein
MTQIAQMKTRDLDHSIRDICAICGFNSNDFRSDLRSQRL